MKISHLADLTRCSVIIIHHKRKSFLTEQLSVYETWRKEDIQFIVVDNSDLTKSEQSSLKLKFPWVHFIFMRENNGPSYSRNMGIKSANGKFIQFVDDDDLITFEKIKFQVDYLEKHPSVDVVVGGTQKLNWQVGSSPDFNAMEVKFPCFTIANECSDILKSDGFFQIGSALFRKEALIRVSGFDEKINIIEDVNLYIRLFHVGAKIEVRNDTPFGLFWRTHPNIISLSTSSHKLFLEGCLHNYLYCIDNDLLKSTQDYLEVYRGVFNITKQLKETNSGLYTSGLMALKKISLAKRLTHLPLQAFLSIFIGFPLLFDIARYYRRLKTRITT